ncbi:MAG: DUF3488 and transglutaminase-like domain-containing protein [Alphaproteobacteria bacterium]|uniref:DUF3488 and transglutaminase-like domain-containing protein n=1 Tax=Candidatus Nitrobium versatile TaxID=2884831 RepID=A0A953M0F1_9BACT|nr:DUF3488 and transglutaminase-like domain-containing protein [Candidatus Nitrobium versatile]
MEKSRSVIKIEDAVKVLTYGIGFVGFLSVVRFAGFFYSLAFGFFYLLSLRSERRKRYPAPRWALNIIALVLIVLTFLGMSSRDIVTPALNSLLILLAIKFLEDKKFRDYMQICVISVFLLTGSSLLSLDIVFLVYFIGLIFLLTSATVLLAYYSQDPGLEITMPTVFKVASTAFLISFLSLPATLLLFILLPRTSFPLLTFLNRQGAALTGFSDSVTLGGISRIQENNEVVFRAHMEKAEEGSLYWRGILLDHFDGVSWKSSPGRGKEGGEPLTVKGKRVEQTIYLEAYDNKYLFALDKPLSLSLKQARMDSSLIHSLPENVTRRIKYQALSVLSPVLQVKEIDRNTYLQLPGTGMEEIRRLVAPLAEGRDTVGAVNTLVSFLRGGGYKYSLERLPLSAHPLHDFLFITKQGNCEYFASALAVMLRVAGIPSRIVGGYRGGLYNEMGGYYLVPQSSAHVWVEFYRESVGWIRVDPTPAGGEGFPFHRKREMLLRLRLLFDTLNYYWNASVLNYDLGKQMSLLYKVRIGFGRPSLSLDRGKLTDSALIFLVVVSGGVVVYYFVMQRKTPEEILVGTFLAKMKKKGYVKSETEGLEEFLERIGEDPCREKALTFVKEFEGYYYRDRSLGKGEIKKLRRMLREL